MRHVPLNHTCLPSGPYGISAELSGIRPPPLSERIYVMAHYLIYLFYSCNQKPISSPERSPVCHSAQLSVRLSVCSRLLRFGNFQTDLCVGLCSSLQDKSIPQRTPTLKWNPFQVANAGCQDRSVAGGDKAIYGEDRRWSLSEVLRPPFYLETRFVDMCAHKDLKINTVEAHLSAVNTKSIPSLLAFHLFSLFSH